MFISLFILVAAQAAVPPGTLTAKAKIDKVSCRIEYQTSSRIPHRVCLPKSEWTRIEKLNEEDLASSRNDRASGRSGTIADNGEGVVVAPMSPGALARAPVTPRPPR